MLVHPRLRWAAALVAAALVLVACGGGGSKSGSGDKNGLVAEVASFDLAVGPPARVLVGVLSNDQRFLTYGSVKLRFAYLGDKQENKPGTYGSTVDATFLPVPGSTPPSPPPADPVFTSDPNTRGVYAAVAGFAKAGFYQAEVTAKVAGKTRTATAALAVNDKHSVPAVGDQAIPVDNLTMSSTDAPQAAIDSRASTGAIPDAALHQTTISAALAAHRPIVAVFATPVFCQSRFCGPITDMVADLAKTYSSRATFIHVEIWRDFQNQTLNKAAADWLLRGGNLNEPWVFVIGSDGIIKARFDNVATPEELKPILDQLPVLGP